MNEYKERKEAIEYAIETCKPCAGEPDTTLVAVTMLANITWALLDIAQTLDNIRENGIQVENVWQSLSSRSS